MTEAGQTKAIVKAFKLQSAAELKVTYRRVSVALTPCSLAHVLTSSLLAC